MKIPQLVLGCALPVMLASTGLARIGETLEECVERYGDPIESPTPDELLQGAVNVPFLSSGIIRDVTFWRGKAAEIFFYNEDNSTISKAQSEILLEDNADSCTWTKVAEDLDSRRWQTSNGERRAYLSKASSSSSLSIRTAEFLDAMIDSSKDSDSRPIARGNELKEAFAAAERASHAPSLTRAERRTMEKAVWRARLVVRRSDTKYLNDLELAELYQKALPINKMQDVQGAINSLLNRKQ